MNSLRFGKLLGIELELHYTFLLLIGFIEFVLLIFAPEQFVPTSVLLLFLFLSVFLHELVHSIVGLQLGMKVKKIILLPIGGIAISEEMPTKPSSEFLIAVAGPLFNFGVVLLIVLLVKLFPGLPMPAMQSIMSIEGLNAAIMGYPLFALLYVNLILGAFNLFLPALPLDGGRVLRSALAAFIGQRKATSIVSRISSFLAILLFLLGFLSGNIIIAIIAVFIYFGSSGESRSVEITETLKEVEFKHLVNKKPRVLDSSLTVMEAFEEMERENKSAYLVELGKGYGVLEAEKLEKLPKAHWSKAKLRQLVEAVKPIQAEQGASKAMQLFLTKSHSLLPVMLGGELIGTIERKELAKLYELTRLKQKQK